MTGRLASGCPGLDAVLGGGLLDPSIALLTGAPGTGKTVLAQQYAFENGSPRSPAFYLSTLAEPLSKITQFLAGLSFCAPERIGTSVVFEDLGGVVVADGLDAGLERITEIATGTPCAMLVIDSVGALRFAARDATDYTRFLHELAGRISALATTMLWLAEYDLPELASSAEAAIADTTVLMSTRTSGQRTSRALQVLKIRGSSSLSGWHSYRVTTDGVTVYHRFTDAAITAQPDPDEERASSGVAALDHALGEGYWPGSSTVVAGPSGSGKTVLGLHFVYRGAELGEQCTFTTSQENRVQLRRAVRGLGWDPDAPDVALHCESPHDIDIDQWFHELLEHMAANRTRRLVIDGLTDLTASCGDRTHFTAFAHSLLARCSQARISTLFTVAVPDLYGPTHLPQAGFSHLSDNLIVLRYVRVGADLDRAMTVHKTRSSHHLPRTTKFVITDKGIEIGDPVAWP
jgi:circadian clock protein KaiC